MMLSAIALPVVAIPQEIPPVRSVVMDSAHILRWSDNGEEAVFFGVNYVAPFSYSYRALGYVNASPQETIRRDLIHFQRLGINAVRLHVWDNEISDRVGNLLQNEHLRLLDYLVAQCRERGIHVLLTPIAWVGNGYPEADPPVEGFSSHTRKSEMGTNPDTIAAETRYLGQFVNHINFYTQQAYKDDPTIVGFECVNEPWSPPADKLKEYIEAMTAAIRETGCKKPLFYCASQSGYRQHNDALQASNVDGVTFGWYPSGLVAQRTLQQNFLPSLDDYPLMSDPAFTEKVKAVYEFDAADVEGSYMYPAFARTFRTNGIQWATQFAYCPLPLAGSNTPYPTHYLNFIYTPHKAVSMMIAAEAFRTLPRGKAYGRYPENTAFGSFQVDYRANRSEMRTDRMFLYSNDTDHPPPNLQTLERIVGCGSSPIVTYEGTGSYFLEKQQSGVWRLEIYPDAVPVDDPHGSPRLDRQAVRVLYQEWPMAIHLPDIGNDFAVKPLNPGNEHHAQAKNGTFSVRPGIYLLTRRGTLFHGSLPPSEFVAPEPDSEPITVAHRPVMEAEAGKPLQIEATIAASPLPKKVTLQYRTEINKPFRTLLMHRKKGYLYTAVVPGTEIAVGALEYTITTAPRAKTTPDTVFLRARSPGNDHGIATVTLLRTAGDSVHFTVPVTSDWKDYSIPFTELRPEKGYIVLRAPGINDISTVEYTVTGETPGEKGLAFSLHLGAMPQQWLVPIVAPEQPLTLFKAQRDYAALLTAAKRGATVRQGLTAGKVGGEQAVSLTSPNFRQTADVSARFLLGERWENRRSAFAKADTVRVRIRASSPESDHVTFALLDRDGVAWGTTLRLSSEWQNLDVPMLSLRSVSIARVPTGYPSSVVNDLAVPKQEGSSFRCAEIEAIQFSLTGESYGAAADGPKGFEVESVLLIQPPL
jgi:hypothetical protein